MWPSLKLRFRFGTPFDRALLEFAQNNFLGALFDQQPQSRSFISFHSFAGETSQHNSAHGALAATLAQVVPIQPE